MREDILKGTAFQYQVVVRSMKHHRGIGVFIVYLLLLALSFVGWHETAAQSNQLILEKEQHWETYGVGGGTCIAGLGSNLFVADVDHDGVIEIITGGIMYWLKNGTIHSGAREAPLKIWNWNGQNLTLEKSHKWAGRIDCVYAGDANGDDINEIVTVGSVTNNTGNYAQLRIWRWDGATLTLETSYDWAYTIESRINSVFISDVDKDGTAEILTCGRLGPKTGDLSRAQLSIWHWNGNSLNLEKNLEWCAAREASANSVFAYDLDNNGEIEIITGGYDNDVKNSSGQLRIWHWNGEELFLKKNEEWRLVEGVYSLSPAGNIYGNTMVNNLKVGDIDDDGTTEIISGGFAYDEEKVNAQLRIWNWNGQTLILEKSHEWTTQDIAEVKAISIDDVDGDGRKEIVISGGSSVYGGFAATATTPELAQLRVWSWDGIALTLKQSQDWYIDEGAFAQNVATSDVDKDGIIEMITVGCTYLGDVCDPDMRIWSIAKDLSPSLYILLAMVVVAIALAVAFLWVRNKRQ